MKINLTKIKNKTFESKGVYIKMKGFDGFRRYPKHVQYSKKGWKNFLKKGKKIL